MGWIANSGCGEKPKEKQLCLCKYDVGEDGWRYAVNYYCNELWFSQDGDDEEEPNYYKTDVF